MTAPLNCISLAQDHLRAQVAATATFQAWTGSTTVAQALARIHQEALPPPKMGDEHTLEELQTFRPYALIWTDEEDGFSKRHTAGGSSFHTEESGVLMLRFWDDVAVAIKKNAAEIDLRFKNEVGGVIDDLFAIAGQSGFLAIEEIALAFGPYRTGEDLLHTQGDAVGIDLRVSWG